MKEGVKITS